MSENYGVVEITDGEPLELVRSDTTILTLVRALVWTTERPDSEGWWWLDTSQWLGLVQIWEHPAGGLYVEWGGDDYPLGSVKFSKARWSGPIPLPVEQDVEATDAD